MNRAIGSPDGITLSPESRGGLKGHASHLKIFFPFKMRHVKLIGTWDFLSASCHHALLASAWGLFIQFSSHNV